MSHIQPLVPILRDQKLRAWPKHQQGGRAEYRPLAEALTAEYLTDAHLAGYSVPTIERRLALDTLRNGALAEKSLVGVAMLLAIFDVDCAAAHKGDPTAADTWWLDEQEKILALLKAHPVGFVYRTRSGYRILYLLPVPLVLKDEVEAEAWSIRYLAWAAYLKRVFDISVDLACKEWVRLFRLPHATRDENGAPERRETIGDAANVGVWECMPSDADREEARKNLKRKSKAKGKIGAKQERLTAAPSEGVLQVLLSKHGLLGQEIAPGTFAAVCPNEQAHTSGERFNGSTVLFAPGAGEIFGHVHCRHAHCTAVTLRDVLNQFSATDVQEAKAVVCAALAAVETAAKDAQREALEAGKPSILIPGTHPLVEGGEVEVSTHDFAAAVLAAFPEDALYRMDFVVGQIAGALGEQRFVDLDDVATRMLVDQYVRLIMCVIVKKGDEAKVVEIFVPCSRDLAGLVRSAAGVSHRVRALRQIVRYPTYLPGFVRAQPGWNPSAGVFYDEPANLVGLTPRLKGALDVLGDLIVDWPFADDASRENTYGLMLTAVLRPAVEGPIPLHLAMASLERTGKGKLIDTTLGCAIQGRPVELIQLGTDEAEREKRITALVLRGASAVHLDNITASERLDSAALASLATAWPTWGGRILGVSKTPQLPNAAVWVGSGNNVQASGELVKRSVPVFLQPRDEHPELRTDFIHEDCFAYALERRRVVLEALLGIVEAWLAAGKPVCPIRMGGFERWVTAVGGCLHHAGATFWMTNFTAWITSADDTQVDAEVLVNAWSLKYGTAVVTAAEILALVEATGAFRWVLSKPSQIGQLVALGRKVLGQLVNRPVKGWIVRRATSGSSATYFLEGGLP